MKDFAAEAERKRLAGDAHAAIEIAEAGLAEQPSNARGRMALALALIDLGDVLRARDELAGAFPPEPSERAAPVRTPPPVPEAPSDAAAALGDPLDEDELDRAFENAETNPDEMISANRLVERTLEQEHSDTLEAGFDIMGSPTYATETMASLLEDQGRRDAAETLRGSIPLELEDENESTQESMARAFREGARAAAADPSIHEPKPLDAAESIADSSGAEWAVAGIGPDHANRVRIVTTLEGWLYNLRHTRAGREAQGKAGRPSQS